MKKRLGQRIVEHHDHNNKEDYEWFSGRKDIVHNLVEKGLGDEVIVDTDERCADSLFLMCRACLSMDAVSWR